MGTMRPVISLKSQRHMTTWSTRSTILSQSGADCSSTTKLCLRSHHKCMMSISGDDLHTARYLSWRKLHLSRAKLKASSKTSALLSGFAMVAMVELQIETNTQIPSGVLIAYAVVTTLLVAVHLLALMISTCILPHIEAICNMDAINLVDESPHERLYWYIETAWAFSTLIGLLLFLTEIAILCLVKFWEIKADYIKWTATIILIPVLLIFIAFAIHFYRSLVTHKYETTVSDIKELEMLKDQIEQGRTGHYRTNSLGGLIQGIHIV